ncbi:MAG: MauE/DoxX family redox-associated membrane protein, partial [Gemmatimonadaceae bacterium]
MSGKGFPQGSLFAASPTAPHCGATFLAAGSIKAVAPYGFSRHFASPGLLPERFLPLAVTVTAAVEAGLGVALLAAAVTSIVWPSSLALPFGLSALSWWGVRSGKVTDCGCYGGYFRPSIRQSLGLNAVFAIMINIPWLLGLGSATISGGQLASIFAAAITAGMVAAWVQHRELPGV